MSSKLEIDVRGLLVHCEELAIEDTKDWRLKKYIKSLDTMIQELDEQVDKPSEKTIDEYRNRSTGLKVLTNYTEPSPREGGGRLLKSKLRDTTGSGMVQEINQIHQSKYTKELRNDLFGGNDGYTVRQRKPESASVVDSSSPADGGDDIQEKITESMLLLAKNLKEQTETANKIIKKDTEVVQASSKMTEKNFGSLKKESDKLQEHSKRAWKCWMWIMIGVVMAIFIFMVMFMKLMKKKV